MKNTAPSLARLMAAFPSLDRDTLTAFRMALQAGTHTQLRFAADMFGGDIFHITDGACGDIYSKSLAEVFNAGDTYAPTVARYAGSTRWMITTVGDLVEALEKRGKRVY